MPPKRSSVRKLPTPIERNAEDAKLLAQVIDYYHETLLGSARGARLPASAAASPRRRRSRRSSSATPTARSGYRLPEKNRVEGAAIRGQLQRIGLLRESGHEHFSGSLVIPVIDAAGEVTEVYGRKINDNLRAGTPLHLYLPGPHRGVWNAAALGGTPRKSSSAKR